MNEGSIKVEPFRRECLGSNSYDVHLGKTLAVYKDFPFWTLKSITKSKPSKYHLEVFLTPENFYLGVTQEYTETHKHVPFLEGKSSVGRLGIDIHATAGKGDVGFCNHWTLEISVKKPVRIYPGMPFGQIIYFEMNGTANSVQRKKIS